MVRARKDSLLMAKTILSPLLMAGLAALAASPAAARDGVRNPSLNSVNQPVVQQTLYLFDVRTSSGGVEASELGRLNQWFRSLQLGYGDRVAVETDGYADERVMRSIGGVASDYGILVSPGAPVTAGGVQPGYARVIVTRSVATVPGCPDWSYASHHSAPISTDSNFGCATNSNLAAMIADPNDLVLGRTGSGISDPRDSSKAIESYRNRVLSGFELKSEKVGKK